MDTNRTVAVLVDGVGPIYIYNLTGQFQNYDLSYVFPNLTFPVGTIGSIPFDSSSTYIIIESDMYNPIVIYNIKNGSTYFSLNHTDIIAKVEFISNNLDFFVIIN